MPKGQKDEISQQDIIDAIGMWRSGSIKQIARKYRTTSRRVTVWMSSVRREMRKLGVKNEIVWEVIPSKKFKVNQGGNGFYRSVAQQLIKDLKLKK